METNQTTVGSNNVVIGSASDREIWYYDDTGVSVSTSPTRDQLDNFELMLASFGNQELLDAWRELGLN